MTTVTERTGLALHPLEPLAEEEYRAVARILRDEGKLAGRMMVCAVALREPDHAALRA